ncbi:MAG: Smr/MutS family protein [Planktomarina sp.]|nr:Smr/MutS family protein [Planktomarina sp.]
MSRKLKPDELEIWRRVAETANPIGPVFNEIKESSGKKRQKPKNQLDQSFKIAGFRVGQNPQEGKIKKTQSVSVVQIPKMDAKAFTKLTRGKMRPEAILDLHGMTMVEAKSELESFILGSAALQRRLVLIITGKGKLKVNTGPIPERHGVLRRNVPLWLRRTPFSSVVLEVSTAHHRHGGSGALYVYLKRKRQ